MTDIEWAHGSALGGFFVLPRLTTRALGAAEIDVRYDEAFVTVLALPDMGLDPYVLAFEGDRDNLVTPIPGVQVNDGLLPGGVPHVAATPEGVDPGAASYAWMLPPQPWGQGWLGMANADL